MSPFVAALLASGTMASVILFFGQFGRARGLKRPH
jgi:hypothetical protein